MSGKLQRKASLLSCILCCHPIDNEKRFNTVGVCGHTGCCSLCALRMRQLLGNPACVFCKTEMPRVICIEREDESFQSFQEWGEDNIGPTHVFDELSGMFFLARDMANVHKLRDPHCKKCSKKFATVAALKTHLLDVHQLQYCSLCLDHNHQFLQELELFSKESLKKHQNKGNPSQGFPGHPRCDFCFSRFYSTAELYDHLHKNHFQCDICLHSLHIENRYYKNYPDLENHFRAEHFLCEESHCLAKKFVVFKSHLDFQSHLTQEHPHLKVSRKIDVHFKIRRASTDENDRSDDSEFQTLDSRTINVADFPSLSGNGGAGSTPLTFWESQTTTAPRMEDFPSLSSASNGSGRYAASSFRNALAPPPTAAMRAHMDNSDSWHYPELPASAVEALGANNPFLRFVKPSKMKNKKGRKSGGGGGQQNGAGLYEEKAPAVQQFEEEEEEEEEEEVDTTTHSKSALVLKIRQVLGSDPKYEIFREDCKAFRLAETEIPVFYTKMKELFSPQDFEKLFLKLMRLFPDKEQIDKFFAHHKQQSRQRASAQGFKDVNQSKKNKQPQQQQQVQKKSPAARRPQPAAASGWANALRETGASTRAASRGPAVVIHNTGDIRGPRPDPATHWSSTASWKAPVAAAAPAVGQTPVSTKIQTAPIESFASMAVSSTPSIQYGTALNPYPGERVTPPPAPAARQNFKQSKSDFPDLPKASRPIGVQAVTRATWDDQVLAIAQDRSKEAPSKAAGKKKQKKKTMTLAEMAMHFG